MKKLNGMLAVLFLSLALFGIVPASTASAATGSATLSGPGVVRAGDKITVTLKLSGSGVNGFQGSINYSNLTYSGGEKLLGNNWTVTFSPSNSKVEFSGYSTDGTAINGGELMRLSFTVGSVSAGTSLSVNVSDMRVTDASSGVDCPVSPWSVKVTPPISSNAQLAALTVKNGTLNPTFSPNTISYTMNVPFEVAKLDIAAVAADSKATISYKNQALTPAEVTNVTVTITAESGAKKTYTIKVSRAQDPNYIPSDNNKLKSFMVKNGALSPEFAPDTTEYTVNVPYEVSKLDITAVTADSKAKINYDNPELSRVGSTNVIVTVTAESGAKKTYTISVNRAEYVSGGISDLESITVDGYVISPPFSDDVTSYMVWLPFETDSVNVSANPVDLRSSVTITGNENLIAGADNPITILCTAENGTKKEYRVIARRPDENGNLAGNPGLNSSVSSDTDKDKGGRISGWSSLWWLTVLLCIVAAGGGIMLDKWMLRR